MRPRAKKLEQTRKAKGRLRMIQHHEQVTRNVSRTCRTPARARWKATLAPMTPAPPPPRPPSAASRLRARGRPAPGGHHSTRPGSFLPRSGRAVPNSCESGRRPPSRNLPGLAGTYPLELRVPCEGKFLAHTLHAGKPIPFSQTPITRRGTHETDPHAARPPCAVVLSEPLHGLPPARHDGHARREDRHRAPGWPASSSCRPSSRCRTPDTRGFQSFSR